MTRRAFDRRLTATEVIVGNQPVSSSAVDDLYARFLRTGELPPARKAAWDVLRRALTARRGGKVSRQEQHRPLAGPPREQVFREAVHESDTARDAARELVRMLAEAGFDPSDPEFIPSDYPTPAFGSTALHILGWPDAWVKPPYEAQMERVLRQHEQLRSACERSEWWYREAAGALADFLNRGAIPDDPDLQLFALTIAEMFAIHAHYLGRGGEHVLAAFERVAATTGAQRDEALRALGQLQAARREVR